MAKKDQEAFNTIIELINRGDVLQFKKLGKKYTITVWDEYDKKIDHAHYDGNTLIEALFKIK